MANSPYKILPYCHGDCSTNKCSIRLSLDNGPRSATHGRSRFSLTCRIPMDFVKKLRTLCSFDLINLIISTFGYHKRSWFYAIDYGEIRTMLLLIASSKLLAGCLPVNSLALGRNARYSPASSFS